MKQNSKTRLIEEITRDLHPTRLVGNLIAGIFAGTLSVLYSISYASLIFSGELNSHIGMGIGIMLFGAGVVAFVVALLSTYPGTIAAPQGKPSAVLALMTSSIATGMLSTSTAEDTLLTVFTAITLTTLINGAVFLALGKFNLGGLVKFVPYPVMGGFLAGSGFLMIRGGLKGILGKELSYSNLSWLMQSGVLEKWLPGLIFAIVLFIVLRRVKHVLIMPALILAGIGMFYLILFMTDTSVAAIREQGWLLGPFPRGGLWRPLNPFSLGRVNWTAILEQAGSLGTILFINVTSILLTVSGFELAVRQDIDLNHELKAAGIANILAGIGGGVVGYQHLGASLLGYKMKSHSRLIGLCTTAICILVILFGATTLSYFPKFIIGGLLMYMGIGFLFDWVIESRTKLSRSDYCIVLLILLIIPTVGYMEGMTVGVIVGAILFIVKYSRINVVKHIFSGATYHSNVERAVTYRRILQEQGEQLAILILQGFIFFGTADNLLNQIRQRETDSERMPLRFIILDFRLVNGLDSSALNSFTKMKHLAENRRCTLVFTNLSSDLRRHFDRARYFETNKSVLRILSDLDHGIEWCEEQILMVESRLPEEGKIIRQNEALLESVFDDIMKSLDQQEQFERIVEGMMTYLEQQEVGEGYYLIRQGDPPSAIYFIESGQVTIWLEHKDSQRVRLRTMGAGSVVGEVSLYLGKRASASVVTTEPSTVYRLSAQRLQDLKTMKPKIAAIFHEFLICLLSERLTNANNLLHVFLEGI